MDDWEPIVSDLFPARLLFWINVHGIPLHYWTDATINAIGEALGPIETKMSDKARLRVQINGLEPLIMCMDLQLPSGDIVEVELEYEKLEKHCFHCKALSHEEDDCPSRSLPRRSERDNSKINISQQNTLDRIEEGRKRQAEKRYSRMQHRPPHEGARWTNYKEPDHRGQRSARENLSSYTSERSYGFEENRRRYVDRTNYRSDRHAASIRSPYRRGSQERSAIGQANQDRNGSSVNPSDVRSTPPKEVNSNPRRSPPIASVWVPRNSLASRLSDPREFIETSEERVPAKDRLSVQTPRTSNTDLRVSLSGARNQQETTTPVRGSTSPDPVHNLAITRPSSSIVFDSGRLGPGDRSPIRTLSEDRIHVSLRLGVLQSETESDDPTGSIADLPTLSKAEGKRKIIRTQKNKRISSNQLDGAITKKKSGKSKCFPSA